MFSLPLTHDTTQILQPFRSIISVQQSIFIKHKRVVSLDLIMHEFWQRFRAGSFFLVKFWEYNYAITLHLLYWLHNAKQPQHPSDAI